MKVKAGIRLSMAVLSVGELYCKPIYVFVLVAQVNKEMEIERELSSLMAKRNIRPCY